MNRDEAILVLTEMQKWRRGMKPYDEAGCQSPYSPRVYGLAIDYSLRWMRVQRQRQKMGCKIDSVFCLEVVYNHCETYAQETDVSIVELGYFSTLEKAIAYMQAYETEHVYAYLISEIVVDAPERSMFPVTVRSYSVNGKENDACLEDANKWNAFAGRSKERIKHQVGEIVECIEGTKLFVGIVAALPPTPEDGFPILDALDDCYLVLPCSEDTNVHYHVPCTHVFPLRYQPTTEDKEILLKRINYWKNVTSC